MKALKLDIADKFYREAEIMDNDKNMHEWLDTDENVPGYHERIEQQTAITGRRMRKGRHLPLVKKDFK